MTAALFDSPAELLAEHEPPEPPRRRQRADIEAQLERIRALNAQGYVARRGACGVTASWDGAI